MLNEEGASASANANAQGSDAAEDEAQLSSHADEVREQRRRRQAAAIAKIKKSKEYKKRKARGNDSDSDDVAGDIFRERLAPLPGQMENCEICDKRFTVTPYSRAGPNGGLLCAKCGKDLAKDDNAARKKKKTAAVRGTGRRQVQSRILDGTSSVGVKSMMALCIETLAKNIHLAEELGDLPPAVVDRVARQLSKRWLVNPQTLGLFLQPHMQEVKVYDGSHLGSDDYTGIFQRLPQLKTLKIRNAIQFQDDVMAYLTSRNISLEYLYIHGANLLSDDSWKAYLEAKGRYLKALQVYYTDKHFGDHIVGLLNDLCPSLVRLKISNNQQVSNEGVQSIANIQSLRHLSLDLRVLTNTEPYLHVLNSIGKNLYTFSLKRMEDLDDRVLDALHNNCRTLSKLRITHNEVMTDLGFTKLFKGWANKPLTFIDLRACRHADSANPRENAHQIGLCSEGFAALMEHSGSSLRTLNVHACRHITREAFENAFAPEKVYPELTHLEISFCEEVTDFIVGSIFRGCPKLKELNVFGCMKVKDVRVPRGKILVGVPNARGMVIEGSGD